MKPSIACIIMAAGSSSRYGEKNKLLEIFNGKPIIERVLSKLPFARFDRCVLVTGSSDIAMYAGKYNIQVLINSHPELGIGRTIKIGLNAIGNSYDGYIFFVCDQPLLKRDTIIALINNWEKNPIHIMALGHKDRTGNPVIFPSFLYDELIQLEDHEPGRVVFNKHRDILFHVPVSDKFELMDIDTAEDLDILKKHNKKRTRK